MWGDSAMTHIRFEKETGKDIYLLKISCDTPGCIAGHACAIHCTDIELNDGFDIEAEGAKALDLTDEETTLLFNSMWNPEWIKDVEEPLPRSMHTEYSHRVEPTSAQAIVVLNRLINHGWE